MDLKPGLRGPNMPAPAHTGMLPSHVMKPQKQLLAKKRLGDQAEIKIENNLDQNFTWSVIK